LNECLLLADFCPSSQHKITDSYRETLAPAVGRQPPFLPSFFIALKRF
jgi:hypothetical protein